jgi:hypothetical protein
VKSGAGNQSVLTRSGSETREGFSRRSHRPRLRRWRWTTSTRRSTAGSARRSTWRTDRRARAFFIAASNNNAYAIDDDGSNALTRAIAGALGVSGAGCGNVMPAGATSTPAIDAAFQ